MRVDIYDLQAARISFKSGIGQDGFGSNQWIGSWGSLLGKGRLTDPLRAPKEGEVPGLYERPRERKIIPKSSLKGIKN